MALGIKAVKGILYIEALLKKIKIVKELFLIELEQGYEAFIPKDLSQDHLPYSLRYYDPVIAYVSENISIHRREHFALK